MIDRTALDDHPGAADRHLARLVDGIPLADDRVLLELANGVGVANDLTRQHEPSLFGRLAAGIIGIDPLRMLHTTQALAAAQSSMVEWLAEAARRGAASDLALRRAAGHLRHLLHADRLRGQMAAELAELAGLVTALAEACDERLGELFRRLDDNSLALQAEQAFGAMIDPWLGGQRYQRLPWACQVLLLAREMASGPCGLYEHRTNDGRYRERLVGRILSGPRPALVTEATFFSIPHLLHQTWRELPSADHGLLVAELLDAGLSPQLALAGGPVTAAVTTTLELATLPEEGRPSRPEAVAMALVRRKVGWMDGSATAEQFITAVMTEQADGARRARARLTDAANG